MTDEDYAYIDADFLREGVKLTDDDRTEVCELGETETIQGVYVVNRGFTVFKKIDILEKNVDYCIVSTAGSDIESYDRIILNGQATEEGRVIY